MKVAIVTLPLHTNYGGILQAFALGRVLSGMGHEPCVVRFSPGAAHNLVHPAAVWCKQRGLIPYSHPYPLSAKEHRTVRQNTSRFIDEYIGQTPPMSGRQLSRAGFDAFVVGSDQVWRHYDPAYFLDFLPEGHPARRIAYAASLGIDRWPFTPQQTAELRRLATRFDSISVREDSAVGLCRENLGVEAVRTLDPTLMLNAGDYMALSREYSVGGNSVMSYILDRTPAKAAIADKVCGALSLAENDVTPPSAPSRTTPAADCVWPPVERWLAGFADARFVVTDSFHGTVFALLFNKPFIAIRNDDRGATRFTSLMRLFGLEERLVGANDTVDDRLIHAEIDFPRVNAILSAEREKSLDFLKRALGRNE